MKGPTVLRKRIGAGVLLGLSLLPADTLHLRDGHVMTGRVLSSDSTVLHFATRDGQIGTYAWRGVKQIDVDRSVTLEAKTMINVRTIDELWPDSTKTLHASLSQPIIADGRTVVPVGADCQITVGYKQTGKVGQLVGQKSWALTLSSLTLDGRQYELQTNEVAQSDISSKRAKTGGGAILGAVIGAAAGGGEGAAIGAGAGAVVGGVASKFSKKKPMIPSETELVFRLENPLVLEN